MNRADLLQRGTRYVMRDIIDVIFMRLQDVELKLGEESESDIEDADIDSNMDSGYGVPCVVDIFYFLCSLLNVVEVVEIERVSSHENVQIFGLPAYGINDLQYCLNIYHFLRRFIRVQLEAFFEFVLLKAAAMGSSSQLQEVVVEGIINFCRQLTFIAKMYVNYDCDPICQNIFEEIRKLLCKLSFPGSSPLSFVQIQAFEGLLIIIHNIADNVDKEDDSCPSGPYPVQITEYRPFWEEKSFKELDLGGLFKIQESTKKENIDCRGPFNRDEKKGLDYLKLCQLISDPVDPKAFAIFFALHLD
ncbi:hypothetical protein GH714_023034 [Hevea brasiliensis]|uniref:Mon2/Sec7/BIG1-like HUS domain-containing protein n=1 Tax=Hevea brasiliensis TaxID=3981 RepID=A0A6A6MPA9_HEVBR|nr:hypothetical protein GH714_023034 [Hevea brasiliensis]